MKNLEENLKILECIHENPEYTQRELVKELDISLGKVNFLIKALVETGIIKLKRFKNSNNKKAYMYLITPKGINEKIKITKEFLKIKTREYDFLQQEIERLRRKLEE